MLRLTAAVPSSLRLGSEFSTTTSLDTSGAPSAPRATCGRLSKSAACSRAMPLCTSVAAPLRIASTLSAEPVATSVNTTSAMPPAVSTVVSRRTQRLRAM